MQREDQLPFLEPYLSEKILDTELPGLSDQVNNVILFVGDNTNPGEEKVFLIRALQSITGARTLDGVVFVLG
jgi:hypothetical protein